MLTPSDDAAAYTISATTDISTLGTILGDHFHPTLLNTLATSAIHAGNADILSHLLSMHGADPLASNHDLLQVAAHLIHPRCFYQLIFHYAARYSPHEVFDLAAWLSRAFYDCTWTPAGRPQQRQQQKADVEPDYMRHCRAARFAAAIIICSKSGRQARQFLYPAVHAAVAKTLQFANTPLAALYSTQSSAWIRSYLPSPERLLRSVFSDHPQRCRLKCRHPREQIIRALLSFGPHLSTQAFHNLMRTMVAHTVTPDERAWMDHASADMDPDLTPIRTDKLHPPGPHHRPRSGPCVLWWNTIANLLAQSVISGIRQDLHNLLLLRYRGRYDSNASDALRGQIVVRADSDVFRCVCDWMGAGATVGGLLKPWGLFKET
ncbi:uncharacterized protein EV422DRAFT_512671 [Fimicolochytrium jonesii]|uniref:uncharacterized protein n=1 Tax=Fimicolochytrium jonesii TaxID=1396493 RepID=UPI0022FF140D|nr:uncharacterized protein EV422DRAFT_512671 [Fimicolochytrium jonesii]KAI8827111.1 hypothetical protein EV422DRAFT_512671 [Fimicolochytrium jonesii]